MLFGKAIKRSLGLGEGDLLWISVVDSIAGTLSSLATGPDPKDGSKTSRSVDGTWTSGRITSDKVSISEVLAGVEGGPVAAEVLRWGGAGLVGEELALENVKKLNETYEIVRSYREVIYYSVLS